MSTTKDELFASTLRKQIAYLEGLLSELGTDPKQGKSIALKINDVETKLRELRSRLDV